MLEAVHRSIGTAKHKQTRRGRERERESEIHDYSVRKETEAKARGAEGNYSRKPWKLM